MLLLAHKLLLGLKLLELLLITLGFRAYLLKYTVEREEGGLGFRV